MWSEEVDSSRLVMLEEGETLLVGLGWRSGCTTAIPLNVYVLAGLGTSLTPDPPVMFVE